ncbi:hypothetical protein [Leptospira barantonii]|uniref:hypothetical protein n=1 Tax=Leptospira barantonii TaxID=2023184 RepID=UPI001FEE17D7|nr:hypothetical protein [Leptospira barantonii]
MNYKNIILSAVSFLALFILFQTISFSYLVPFQEKNSFLYDRLSRLDDSLFTKSTSLHADEPDGPVLFLGDSQILSGIHPMELEKKIGLSIWFLPRPSEQPEGMLLRYLEYEKKIGIKPSLVIVNGSVFSLSDMDVASAHKSLVLNYDSFHPEIFTNVRFGDFYLKNLSTGLYYLLGRIFPFLRLNASVSTTVKIVGEGDEFSYTEKNLDRLLSGNPFEKWRINRNRNRFLEMEYSKNKGYLDWGKQVPYDGICIPNSDPIALPPSPEAALQRVRKSSLEAWKELFSYLKEKGVPVLALSLPFRPDFDARVSVLPQNSLWDAILIEKEVPSLKVGSLNFLESDFGDYTHLNTCGMQKLVPILAERILNFTKD